MAKHVGVKLPKDLIDIMKKGTVAVLATFSEQGFPHTTPLQCIYPNKTEGILIAIHKEHQGYYNMVWQKKVMLSFLDEGNVAYSVLGRAGVLRAPSNIHPLMVVIQIDIIDIKSDRSVLTRIDAGIKWSYTSWEAEELSEGLLNELKEIAKKS